MSRIDELREFLLPFGFRVEKESPLPGFGQRLSRYKIWDLTDPKVELATGHISDRGISIYYRPRRRMDLGWRELGVARSNTILWEGNWALRVVRFMESKTLSDDEIFEL